MWGFCAASATGCSEGIFEPAPRCFERVKHYISYQCVFLSTLRPPYITKLLLYPSTFHMKGSHCLIPVKVIGGDTGILPCIFAGGVADLQSAICDPYLPCKISEVRS